MLVILEKKSILLNCLKNLEWNFFNIFTMINFFFIIKYYGHLGVDDLLFMFAKSIRIFY